MPMQAIILTSLLSLLTLASQAGQLIIQSTTSTKNSGLYDFVLPKLQADTGITVHVVAVGTGQAISNARSCDGDILLVHAKSAEESFVARGFGLYRQNLMFNDFILVGPPADPAGIQQASSAVNALERIGRTGSIFVSRGDDSGTHKKERQLWRGSAVSPWPDSGDWYLETGSGMGATLNTSVELQAYTLTDRATWLRHGRKKDHRILFEGDPELFNQYGIIPVNPEKCPHTYAEQAKTVVDWFTSARGQAAIGAYQIDGQTLFFPNAKAP